MGDGDSDEKRLYSPYMLKTEPIGFPDRVGVRDEWKREAKDWSNVSGQAIGRMELPTAEMGRTSRGAHLGRRPRARF